MSLKNEYRYYKFPSAYKKIVGSTFLETVKLDNLGEYVVGELAVKHGNHLWDTESLIKFTPLFLKYLKEQKKEDIKKITLSVPTATFATAVKKDRDGIKDNYFNKMIDSIKNSLGDEVKDIRFLPQGVSSIYYYKQIGEIKDEDVVLTIDGGFNTLNIALIFVANQRLQLLMDESVFDKGIRTLLQDKFLPLLKELINEEIPNDFQFLKEIFLKQEITIGFKEINVSHQVETAVQNYLDEIMEYILHVIKRKTTSDYNVINVVGGISYYLADKINTSKKLILPKKDGEFFTAIGMATKHPDTLAVDLGFGDVKIAKKIKN